MNFGQMKSVLTNVYGQAIGLGAVGTVSVAPSGLEPGAGHLHSHKAGSPGFLAHATIALPSGEDHN